MSRDRVELRSVSAYMYSGVQVRSRVSAMETRQRRVIIEQLMRLARALASRCDEMSTRLRRDHDAPFVCSRLQGAALMCVVKIID